MHNRYTTTHLFLLLSLLFLPIFAEIAHGQESEQPLSVPISTAEVQRVTLPATYGARIRPGDTFTVGAPISGFVEELSVELGDLVRIGEQVGTIQRSSPGEEFRPAAVESRFSGTAVELSVRPGEFVNAGQEILRLSDMREERMVIRVSDKDIVDITEGETVSVTMAASGAELQGRVRRIHPEADYARGLFSVEVTLRGGGDGASQRTRVGAYGEVTFRVRPFEGVVVPVAAVTERQGGAFLYVVEEGVAARRPVVTAGEYGDQVALADGLEPGEQYVPAPVQGLREGVSVTPREGASR